MPFGSPTSALEIVISAIDDASGTLQKVGAQLGTLDQSTNTLSKSFKDAGQSITDAGKSLLPASLAAAGALGLAAKSAADFQQKMELLHTQAGMSQTDVDGLNSKLLEMAPAVGAGPSKLADAFYSIASAHQGLLTTAQMLDMLKVSAEGAAIGQSDLTETADALSGAVASGIKGAQGYAQMMGVLNAIVGAGKMHMQDLIGAMGTGFLSAAATAGVSLQSVGTALATMTDNGVPAEQAATRIRMAMALMASPSQVAAKALAAIGLQGPEVQAATESMTKALADAHITTTKLAEDMRQPNGLLVAMQDLKTHLEASGVSADAANAIIARSFGGGRTDAAILTMLQNMDRMHEKFQLINDASGKFADDWAAQQQTASQHLKDFTASIDALGVRLGNIVLPVLTRVADALSGVADWLGHLSPQWQTFIVVTLGLVAAAAPLLLILGGIVSAIGALISPVGLVVVAILAVGVAIAATIAYWRQITSWIYQHRDAILVVLALFAPWMLAVVLFAKTVQDNWATILKFFQTAWDQIGQGIDWMTHHWAEAIGMIIGFFLTLPIKLPIYVVEAIVAIINYLASVNWGSVFYSIYTSLTGAFKMAINWITNINWGALLEGVVKGAVAGIPGLGSALHTLHIPGFAAGTPYAPGGLALVGENGPELVNLPRGSQVTPADQTKRQMGGVHIENFYSYSQADLSAFATELAWRLR